MSEFRPVLELPSAGDVSPIDVLEGNVPPLIWEFHAPSSVAEHLQVNMSALRLYQRIGAISGSVVLEYQGETSEFTPAGISGINADGSAAASRAGVLKKADKSEAGYIDPISVPKSLRHSVGKTVMLHNLNKPELAQNISDSIRNKGQTRDQAWAEQLDLSFRDSFRRGAWGHMMRFPQIARYIDYGVFSVMASSTVADAMHGGVSIVVPMWLAGQAYFTAWESRILAKTNSSSVSLLHDKRWSVFYAGHQSDRYLALNALSRVSRLIKYVK